MSKLNITNNNFQYINLRILSNYSKLKSIIKPDDLIAFCQQKSLPAVGLCDEMNLCGIVKFHKAAIKAGIKPITGCVVKIDDYGMLPLFIKNMKGYEWLSYHLSQAYIKGTHSITIEDLQTQEGLLCLTGSDNSIFYQDQDNLVPKIQRLKSIFHDDLFIEIQNLVGKNNLLKLAQEQNIPIVVTHNVFCLSKEDIETLFVFRAIQDDLKYNAEDIQNYSLKHNYFQQFEDLDLSLRQLTEGIQNSVIIAKKCSFLLPQRKPSFPFFSEDDNTELRRNASAGLEQRLLKIPEDQHETYWKRLHYELDILISKDFAGYFLITADFIQYAKSQGIPVGPGRGSGAGSLVAYSLTITNIDPMYYDLIFERFINPGRDSLPDFDIDFCPDGRKQVIEYLATKYGKDNISYILTFLQLQARRALLDVCKIFNISFKEASNITKLIPYDQINKIKLAEVLEKVPQLKVFAQSEKYSKIFKIALKIENLTRNFSKHASGIIIAPTPIYNIAPIWREEEGDLVSQFDLGDLEYVGLVKFDFLGLRTLTVIYKTCALIEKTHNIKINFDSIPTDDLQTFQFFQKLDLEGIFQFESGGIKEVISKFKPGSIKDLTMINALYRPGPMKFIDDCIKGKENPSIIKYLHLLIIPILKETFGVIVYQEQVMDIAKVCANYTLGEADLLRRAMGKKKPEEMQIQREKFIQGALKNNISQEIAEQLFNQMNEFSGYGFNKSHSAPYALIGYICAYLKTHYPKEFITIMLSEEKSNMEKVIKLINNLKQLNIKLLPPCVQNSFADFSIQKDSVVYGLSALKNIGEGVAESIIYQREKGIYTNIYDFINRNNKYLNKKNWETLVKSGALDIFGFHRSLLLENFTVLQKNQQIFDEPNKKKLSKMEIKKLEIEAFGFDFSGCFRDMRSTLKTMNCFTINEIKANKNLNLMFIAIEIISIKRRRTSQGKNYAFVDVQDETGMIDIVIFSNVLQNVSEFLTEGNLVMMELKIDRNGNNFRFICQKIVLPNIFLSHAHNLIINIYSKSEIKIIEDVINQNPGNITVFLNIKDEKIKLPNKIKDSLQLREILENMNIDYYSS